MRREIYCGLVLSAGLALTACGTDPEPAVDDDADQSASADESAGEGTEAEGVDPEEPTADQEAETSGLGPVKDVRWSYKPPPDSWEQMDVGQGILQWQIGEDCLLTLNQPAGLNPNDASAEQLLKDIETQSEEATGTNLLPGEVTTRSFPVLSNQSQNNKDLLRMPYTTDTGIQGEIYVYREGQFGLILDSSCESSASYDEADEKEFQPFIEELGLQLDY